MEKIDRRKSYYMVFDTETTNGFDDPLVYDIGGAIVDKNGKVFEDFSFVVYETFCGMKDLMKSAYYAHKIPQYEQDIKDGKRKVVRFATARRKIYELCKKYNVKATFFVTGYGSDEMIAREYNEGHAVALHSFTHDYANIYSSIDNYFADLYRIQERVKNITGYTSYLMRFPGGSSNTVSAKHDGGIHIMSKLVKEVGARGFTYFDWNVTSGDAGGTTSSDGVYQNVINRVYRDGKSIVLQHDSKGFSVDAVERIIQWGLANGFTFDKLDANSFTAHHGVNN